MKYVAPLRYDVIFKKAFCDGDIFTAFVKDALGVTIEIDKVETEKSFSPPIGRVASRFDLFAEDKKNRIIVDIQHERYPDHYDAFLHYHCAAILEQIANAENYRPKLAVFSLIVLTSGDKHKHDVVTIDGSTELAERLDPKDRAGQGIGEIPHKVMYVCPKYVDEQTPAPIREWLRAIDDTLDEVVEEGNYQHPQVRRIFDLIERDQISPDERARMIEEYNREQLHRETFAEGIALGEQRRNFEIARALLAAGVDITLIIQTTGLSAEEVVALKV